MKGKKTSFALWGLMLIMLGIFGYLIGAIMGAIMAALRLFLPLSHHVKDVVEIIIWYSATPVIFGVVLITIDLIFVVPSKRNRKKLRNEPIENTKITVVLTAYNDQESIGSSVRDFLENKLVQRVIVISNNSSDQTMEVAANAGAIVYNEEKQGYGACVMRALSEASKYEDTEIVALCEGDMTFRAYDLPKFVAYLPHADIVNGTRIVEQLQQAETQLSMFMHYGNFAVAKLLEAKYLGDATLSDVGTTYKVIRSNSLRILLKQIDSKVNLEFNPYFLEQAIRNGFSVLECPITFHPRVGISKGGNISNRVALRVGVRMIVGIIIGWSAITS
ncbi:glycosyltransferase [Herbaspirillum rhizosphaerae]|uniref:Glycosyltransferase n=1 Tax=Herbaspirillum rhizosphaerae TaxID=346179 RepID=A0ABW8Z866_9BURK